MVMVHDALLRKHRAVFVTLTGLRPEEFDALAKDVLPQVAPVHLRGKGPAARRQRAPGAGHPFRLSPRTQLLLTLVWLRQYPTTPVLGFLFGVHTTPAQRTLQRVLPVLEADGREQLRRARPTPADPHTLPPARRRSRRTLEDLLQDVPELAVIVDTFEQRVQRPKGRRTEGTPGPAGPAGPAGPRPGKRVADDFYSGKKKQHTLKAQVAIHADTGKVCDVPESVPGPTNDLHVLNGSGLWEWLPPDVAVGGDLAYVGINTAHPSGLGLTPRRKPRCRPRPDEDVVYNTTFARWRVAVEHTIGRVRRFQCLTQTDRDHRQRHTARVVAVAGLVNRQLDHRLLGVPC